MVISDASPLICLAKAGLLGILEKLYGKVYIPPAVRKEILAGPDTDPMKSILKEGKTPWIEVLSLPYELSPLAKWHIGAGEAEVIELARINEGACALLDDRQARLYAERLGVRVKGTIGLIIEAKQKGILPDLEQALKSIEQANLWLEDSLKKKILKRYG